MAAGRLSTKDGTFAERMNMLSPSSHMKFSNQLHMATMHTPQTMQTMQTTLHGWLSNENTSFEPRIGDNFFPYGMRQGKFHPDLF